MTGQEQTLADTFLHSLEGIADVFGIRYRRYITTYETLTLCEGTAAQTKFVEREIDVVEGAFRFVGKDGTYHLADVADLTTRGDDDGTWRDNL